MVPLLLIGVVALAFIAASGGAHAQPAPAPHPAGPGLPPGVPSHAPADGGQTAPTPGITPGTIFGQQGQGIPTSPRQAAAIEMIRELNRVQGFREYDQPIYKAYQHQAGLTADGFPGTHTMNSLFTDATALGVAPPSVPVYAWKAKTDTLADYDGINAPTADEWLTAAPN